jgi:hypothetical protein
VLAILLGWHESKIFRRSPSLLSFPSPTISPTSHSHLLLPSFSQTQWMLIPHNTEPESFKYHPFFAVFLEYCLNLHYLENSYSPLQCYSGVLCFTKYVWTTQGGVSALLICIFTQNTYHDYFFTLPMTFSLMICEMRDT